MLFGVKHESENNIINSSLIILGIPMIQKRVAPWGVSWRAFGFFCGDLKLEEGLEKQYIEKALEKTRGNVSRCAELCGLSRRSLTSKISEYNIDKEQIKKVLK